MDMSVGEVTLEELEKNCEVILNSEDEFLWQTATLDDGQFHCPSTAGNSFL